MTVTTKTDAIRKLNDALRITFTGGKVMMTAAVAALPPTVLANVLTAVRNFSDFDEDNDPHSEHDFVSVEVGGERYFAKIDYYDKTLEYGSEDPADPNVTTRVLTIMLASDY